MATQKEIKECFDNLRQEIASPSSGMRGPKGEARLLIMGLFLLESFLFDVKRIANVLSEAANDRDGMGNK